MSLFLYNKIALNMNSNKIIFITGFVFYGLIYLKFYPPFYSFADEKVYIVQSQSLLRGKLTVSKWTEGFAIHKGRIGIIPKYPPFYSLLFLTLPLKVNFYLVFFVSFLLHLSSFYLFYKILEFYRLNPLFSLFYLFHPSFVFFSRTIMPDFATSFLFILTFYLYLRKNSFSFVSNFILSLLKPPNFLYSFPFIYDSFKRKKYKWVLYYSFSAFLGALFIFVYLYFLYGKKHPDLRFSIEYFLRNLKVYFIYLNLNYPLLLIFGIIGIILIRNLRNILTGFIPVLLLYLFYVYHYEIKGNYIISSIAGLRFFLPFVAFLVIGYSSFIQGILKLDKKYFFVFLLILGSLISMIMMRKHNTYLQEFKKMKDYIYNNTKESDFLVTHFEISKLLLPLWGKRKYTHFTDWGRFTLFEHVKDITELPDSFILVYTLKSGEKNLYYVKSYADSVLKIFPAHKILFSGDYLYIYRVYNYNNF